MLSDREEFLKKVSACRFKTAELAVGGGFVGIDSSYVDSKKAWFWAEFDGEFSLWSEDDLKNFCL